MHRIRVALAIVFVLVLLAAPAFAAVGDVPTLAAQTDEVEDIVEEDPNGPAVLVEEDVAALDEDAWTFRYLIPTLIGATGLAVAAVAIGYAVRVRARYRVVE